MGQHDKEYILEMVKKHDVKFIRLWFTDILGYLKSFAITVEELEGALEEGMGFDGDVLDKIGAGLVPVNVVDVHDKAVGEMDVVDFKIRRLPEHPGDVLPVFVQENPPVGRRGQGGLGVVVGGIVVRGVVVRACVVVARIVIGCIVVRLP